VQRYFFHRWNSETLTELAHRMLTAQAEGEEEEGEDESEMERETD
jgi:hypothetical protein